MARKRGRSSRPAAVGELLSTAFQGTPTARLLKEGGIWRVWDEVVGPQIASRAKPSAIRAGTLTVVVASAPWLQQLNFLKVELKNKLNAALGEELVKDIYLKSGTLTDPESSRQPRRRKKLHRLTPAEEARIAGITAEVSDPDLHDALSALFTRQLASKE